LYCIILVCHLLLGKNSRNIADAS